jgi:hypothetical protein
MIIFSSWFLSIIVVDVSKWFQKYEIFRVLSIISVALVMRSDDTRMQVYIFLDAFTNSHNLAENIRMISELNLLSL